MCEFGMAAQCRSYFVVLTLHGYETHAIFDNDQKELCVYGLDTVSECTNNRKCSGVDVARSQATLSQE